jgi:hypothetical protein
MELLLRRPDCHSHIEVNLPILLTAGSPLGAVIYKTFVFLELL